MPDRWARNARLGQQAPKEVAMTQDIVAIARSVYQAYVSKDRAAIEGLISDDFHFTSPLDNRIDRATYFKRRWPNSQNIREFDFIRLVPINDQVVITYIGTNADGRRFQNTELLTVRGAQVVEAEVYFGWSIPHKAADGGFVVKS
jgi:hypothetical protein